MLSLLGGFVVAAQFAAPAGAQEAPARTSTPTRTPGPVVTITFRCPGVTAVSIGVDLLGADQSTTAGGSATTGGAAVTPSPSPTPTPRPALSPVDAAASPCVFEGAEPEIDWSADHIALRMSRVGTWKQKMRVVLEDFDTLHALYVADDRVKDMGMWPARMQETLELLRGLAFVSRSDQVYYYVLAMEKEYIQGVYEELPLLTSYALQARQRLDELTGSPTPTPVRRAR